MRKIDAVLLSALIVYDYSAQSLVDTDNVSFGHSFINNEFHDNKLTNPEFNFTPEFNNEEATVVRGVKHLNAAALNKEEKNITYYELAKINPATAPKATAVENTVAVTENTEAVAASVATVENVAFDQEKVEVNEEAYTSTTPIAEATINEHVSTVADNATFDNDNDGVFDVEDKCPGVAGVARFEGCPVPDSDADGVNDEEDRCPLEKGSADNFGCPVSTSEAAETVATTENQNNNNAYVVSFQADSKTLSTEDFNVVLQITDILVRNSDAKVEIEGSANENSGTKAPTERISNYFKDLGVNNSQITVKPVEEGKELINISKVSMRILQ
ncbi:MAG: hypothetical protein QM802_08270 [Agriterribacter sp.]